MTSDPKWMQFAREFGAPLDSLKAAAERTGVSSEAFLAIATDLAAIRALLDLALRTGTIAGYQMINTPGPSVVDEETVWNKGVLERMRSGGVRTFRMDRGGSLSDPDESVTP